jgi:hypothetical protein
MKADNTELFPGFIKERVSPEAWNWMILQAEKVRAGVTTGQLCMIFAQVPRYSNKSLLGSVPGAETLLGETPLKYEDWSVETFCRVWMLLQLPAEDEECYVKIINGLFDAAEMNELVALYKALALFKFPERWVGRCEEGIRSNIGWVLEAIMYHNPYPAAWLSEAAWNQMILKAFFTEKDVSKIYKMEQRINPSLIARLEDYKHEREAAGRTVNPAIPKLINLIS